MEGFQALIDMKLSETNKVNHKNFSCKRTQQSSRELSFSKVTNRQASALFGDLNKNIQVLENGDKCPYQGQGNSVSKFQRGQDHEVQDRRQSS